MKIKTYLINLDDSTERLNDATEQLDLAGMTFERISAFDGRKTDPANIKEYDDNACISYMGRKMTGGELGCYFSHMACVERFLETDADYAIVLEDDMTAPKDLFKTSVDILQYLKGQSTDWYLMNIGANKIKIATAVTEFSAHTLYKAHYFPMTTTGLIWSREGAKEFLSYHEAHSIFCPVDNFFRYWLTDNNKGLSVFPPLTPPSGADSDIDVSSKRNNIGRHALYGVIKQRRLWGDKFKALRNKY